MRVALFSLLFLICGCAKIAAPDKKLNIKAEAENRRVVEKFCQQINERFKAYRWKRIVCNPDTWEWDPKYTSPKGYPLIYKEFFNGTPKSTTLVLCGVHGDELPVMYLCIHMVRDIIFDNPSEYENQQIVIAPLVNPDGFLRSKPTRQNGNGIDLNRNFPTKDFQENAVKEWQRRTKSSPRKYPGSSGGSEIETKFQMHLIDHFKPDKIVSVHSPYGWLDVDSPSKVIIGDEPDGYDFRTFLMKSKIVAAEMSKRSNNYRVINFRVYPGSLGNYAARERGIPTYTLELPTSSSQKAHKYWLLFRHALRAAVQFELKAR